MAYAFSKINSMMGKDKAPKADIFGGQQEGQPQQNGMQGLNLTGSEGGAIGSGGGASSPQAPSGPEKVKDSAPSSASSLADIYSKNTQKTPGFVGNVQSGVNKAQEKLNAEVESYKKPAEYSWDFKPLIEGLKGPNAAESERKIMEQLNPTTKPGEFKSEVDTQFNDLEKLKSQAGIADLYKGQSGGGMYSSRLARFDAGALESNKEFQKQKEDAIKAAENVRKQQLDLTGPGESDIEKTKMDAAKTADEKKKQDLINLLTGYKGELLGGIKSRAAAENELPKGWDQETGRQYFETALKNLEAETPGISQHLQGQYMPYGMQKYWTPSAGVGEYDLATEGDVTQFNNINRLLGLAGASPTDTLGIGPGAKAGSFDQAAYEADLRKFGQGSMSGLKPASSSVAKDIQTAAAAKGKKGSRLEGPITEKDVYNPTQRWTETGDAANPINPAEKAKKDREVVKKLAKKWLS